MIGRIRQFFEELKQTMASVQVIVRQLGELRDAIAAVRKQVDDVKSVVNRFKF